MPSPTDHYEPEGIRFFDAASLRLMKLVTAGPYRGWLVFLGRNGAWVTLHKATPDDVRQLAGAGYPVPDDMRHGEASPT